MRSLLPFSAALPLTAVCLTTLLAATDQATAQTPAATVSVEEIIVTAQRREQRLQEVPMAISAFSEEALAALQADSLDAIQGAVPNLNLVQGRGSNSSVNAFIRGVGQPDALQSFDPAVGVYLDDVYMSRIQGALFKLYDIERVEVLRGPQGTLYGKNTPGGAIRLVTKTPGQDFEAQAALLYGDYSRVQARAYVAGPASDTLALSASLVHEQRDGFVTDPSTGREYNDENTTSGRIKANWDVTDKLNAVLAADWTREDVELTLGRAEDALWSVDLATGIVVRELPPTEEWNFETQTSLGDADGQTVYHHGLSLTLDWTLGDNTSLKSITAYRDLETDLFIDIDATEWEIGDVLVQIDQQQISQEFQLLGGNGDNLNWVAGLYYLSEDVPSHQEAYAHDFLLFGGVPISFLRTIDDDLESTSYAAFGQVDIGFAEAWNVGLGIRYTQEEKDYTRATSTFSDILGNADPAFAFTDSDDWDSWTPTVSLDFAASEDVHFYGRVAKGFKSGGFNGRANSAPDVSTFEPETVWTAELGAKTIVAGGRLRANYAIFTSKYEDFQARVSVADGIDFRFPVLNAAELDIKGAEIEAVWTPVDSFQVATQVGYLDAEYGSGGFSGSDGVADEPAFSPEWTGRIAGTYTVQLAGGGLLAFSADANYRDSMWLSVENVAPLTESDYWIANGLVSYTSPEGHWILSAGVKNATDEVYRVEGQEFRSVGNIQTAYYGDPRTWSLMLEYRY